MRDIWSFLLQTMTASGVAVLLLLLKAVFRDKLPPRWQFAAWGVLALFLTGGVLMEAYTAYGQAGRIIAVLGFLALLLALVGLYQGIRGLREEDSYRLFPYVGCVLNGLLLTAFICVYMAGW